MELRECLLPLRKWWWLLLAAMVVSTASSFLATHLQVPLYQSQSTLMIGQALADPNPDNAAIYLTQQLAQSYAELARRQPLRRATMEALGMIWLPEYQVNIVPGTQLLEIIVIDSDPVRSQAVAHMLAQQLVLLSPTSTQPDEKQRQQFIDEQLAKLETKIHDTEEEIQQLQEEVAGMISARQIADTESQITTLQAKLNDFQNNYATLLSNTRAGAINTLTIVEEAELPTDPVNAHHALTLLLGAAIGFTLSTGTAYLLEYLDNTLQSPADFREALALPIMGFIQEMPAAKEGQEGVLVAEQPRSPVAEAFRAVRTNLEFAAVDKPLRTVLLTSLNPGDGKSSTACNLAASIAQSGKKVLLIDADLRRPRIHHFFDCSNRFGLSDLFRDQMTVPEAAQAVENVPDLLLITSGGLPPNPAELLGARKMDRILAEAITLADIVLIDGPPFVVSDTAILSAKVDGVVVVVQPGRTTAEAAKALLEQLHRAEAHIVGLVLNRIPRKGSVYYRYRYHYAPEYYADPDNSTYGVNGQVVKKRRRERGFLSR